MMTDSLSFVICEIDESEMKSENVNEMWSDCDTNLCHPCYCYRPDFLVDVDEISTAKQLAQSLGSLHEQALMRSQYPAC